MEYTILILLLPLLSFLGLGLLGTKLRPFVSGCIGSVVLAAVARLPCSISPVLVSTGSMSLGPS